MTKKSAMQQLEAIRKYRAANPTCIGIYCGSDYDCPCPTCIAYWKEWQERGEREMREEAHALFVACNSAIQMPLFRDAPVRLA